MPIAFRHVGHTYSSGTPYQYEALKDAAFGPKNFGLSESEAEDKARKALLLTGLDEDLFERSPLELSGGKKRRVAIAGILAMDPEVLVLDEPTAGLDPAGTKAMMSLFYKLNKKYGKTVLMVTHDMENVFTYCDDVIVVEDGRIRIHTDAQSFFRDSSICKSLHILPPALIRMRDALNEKGFHVPADIQDMEALADCIAQQVKKHG